MRRHGASWGAALADLADAGRHSLDGRRRDLPALLETAISTLEALDMVLHAAAARRRFGQVIGGAEGIEQVAAAEARMAEAGVENPARMTDLLAPGRWPALP